MRQQDPRTRAVLNPIVESTNTLASYYIEECLVIALLSYASLEQALFLPFLELKDPQDSTYANCGASIERYPSPLLL